MRRHSLLLPALLLASAPPAHAVVTDWKLNTGGNYNNANNWTNGAPDGDDFVTFRRGTGVAYTVNLPGNNLGGFNSFQAQFLRFGNNTVSFTQGINAGLTVTSTNNNAGGNPGVIIAELPNETATVNSAIAFAAHSVTLGHSTGTLGTLNVTSGTWSLSADDTTAGLLIGRNGRGAVNVSGTGKINLPNTGLTLGGAGGALSLSGPNAALTMGRTLSVGNGTLTISNAATFTKGLDGNTDVGFLPGTVATFSVQGPGSSFSAPGAFSNLAIGGSGTGAFSVSGGAQALAGGDLRINANGTLLVDGPGSSLSVGGEILFNGSTAAPAVMILSNGGIFTANNDFVATTISGNRFTLDGGVLDLQNHAFHHPFGVPTYAIQETQFLSGTLKNIGALHRMEWLNKTGSGTLTLPTANTFNVPVRVAGGTLLVAHAQALGDPFLSSLFVVNGAMARFAPGLSAIDTNLGFGGSTNNWQGTIDIANNAILMAVDADPVERNHNLQRWLNQIVSAKTGGPGGAWTGNGITSSTLTPDTSLALADNAVLGYTTFRGIPVDQHTAILVQALFGDATLNGAVDAFDLNLLATNWQKPANALWSDGDFNHDGKVDAFDLNLLAAHWQSGTAGSLEAALAAFPLLPAPAPVPEPATLSLLALASLPLLTRHRRR